MKNENHLSHKRYYIFMHVPRVIDSIRYREQTGRWEEDFEKANLWSNRDFALNKAAELQRIESKYRPDHVFCVGEVDVSVNPFYSINVIDEANVLKKIRSEIGE